MSWQLSRWVHLRSHSIVFLLACYSQNIDSDSYLCSLIGSVSLFLWLLLRFSLWSLVFRSLTDMPRFLGFCFYFNPTWCSLSSLGLWFGIWCWFRKILSCYSFKYVFGSSLSSLVLPECLCCTFCRQPTVLAIFCSGLLFPLGIFSLVSSFQEFYWYILLLKDSFLMHVQSTKKPSKALFTSVRVSFFSSIYFQFFLRISISLLILPTCSCMLSTLSISTLSILITVVSNSQSDNSNSPVISNSHACSVSSNCVFCLLVYLAIFFFLDSQTWHTG